MAQYIITGGKKLKGEVRISGGKNEILPCMAAALLTSEPVRLTNVPAIRDVAVMIELLKRIGASVEESEDSLTIHAEKISDTNLPVELTNRLRASILLAGPLLARVGKVEFGHPGGDVIGRRTLEPHFDGFTQMGYKLTRKDQHYKLERLTYPEEVNIFMEEASVTGVENLILGAVLQKGSTIIRNAPEEPHVQHLCKLLVRMGAEIKGIGSSTLEITGVEKLSGAEFRIGIEHIEVGTYAVAAAITGGEIKLTNCSLDGLEPIVFPLQKMGVQFKVVDAETVIVSRGKLIAYPDLKTNLWPGFPTDLMSVMVVLATQAEGISLLHDWMYESRMFFVDKLITMGAHITIADPHRVLVYGPTSLLGRVLETPDIRAGMALVLAALVADGTSTINRAELIERGYVDVVGTLSRLGAEIVRVD